MGYLGSKVLLRIERDSLSAPVVWEGCLRSMPALYASALGIFCRAPVWDAAELLLFFQDSLAGE